MILIFLLLLLFIWFSLWEKRKEFGIIKGPIKICFFSVFNEINFLFFSLAFKLLCILLLVLLFERVPLAFCLFLMKTHVVVDGIFLSPDIFLLIDIFFVGFCLFCWFLSFIWDSSCVIEHIAFLTDVFFFKILFFDLFLVTNEDFLSQKLLW